MRRMLSSYPEHHVVYPGWNLKPVLDLFVRSLTMPFQGFKRVPLKIGRDGSLRLTNGACLDFFI